MEILGLCLLYFPDKALFRRNAAHISPGTDPRCLNLQVVNLTTDTYCGGGGISHTVSPDLAGNRGVVIRVI